MPVNINPIYSISGDLSSNLTTGMAPTLTTAANDYTGISSNNKLVWTAGANGGYIERIRFKAVSSNVATVARIYINNGSDNTSAANNSFYGEISLPATTASATSATVDIDYPMNFALNAGFSIYVGLGTTVANGWVPIGVGGQY